MLFLHRFVITLQQVHSHFHSKFCTVCELVLLPSNFSTSCFLKGRPEAAYILCLSSYPFYLTVNTMFQKAVPMQYVTKPITLPSINSTQYIPLLLDTIPFSLDRSNSYSPSLFITTYTNLQVTSDPGSHLSTFQHYTKLCSTVP